MVRENSILLDYGVMVALQILVLSAPVRIWVAQQLTGDLQCGNCHLRGVRLVNSSYGNKPKEFESLRLTIKIGTKQLSVTLLNSVITLKLIIWVRKKKER